MYVFMVCMCVNGVYMCQFEVGKDAGFYGRIGYIPLSGPHFVCCALFRHWKRLTETTCCTTPPVT